MALLEKGRHGKESVADLYTSNINVLAFALNLFDFTFFVAPINSMGD